jgi:hypothetical protein
MLKINGYTDGEFVNKKSRAHIRDSYYCQGYTNFTGIARIASASINPL